MMNIRNSKVLSSSSLAYSASQIFTFLHAPRSSRKSTTTTCDNWIGLLLRMMIMALILILLLVSSESPRMSANHGIISLLTSLRSDCVWIHFKRLSWIEAICRALASPDRILVSLIHRSCQLKQGIRTFTTVSKRSTIAAWIVDSISRSQNLRLTLSLVLSWSENFATWLLRY